MPVYVQVIEWTRTQGFLQKARSFFRSRKKDYQRTRQTNTQERWNLIQSRTEGTSLLDVGCNSGALTALAAGTGFFAVGLDANWEMLSEARRKCKPNLSLAYTHFIITPESVGVLPVFDIVLCLSVYHHWHHKFGHEAAQRILCILGNKARRRLFFEPASKQSKYGPEPPAFVDHNERSIIKYNEGMLGGLFGQENVEFVGATSASRTEPLRYLFAIDMKARQGSV